jgi:ACS family allantoate permease-like MFS transporter
LTTFGNIMYNSFGFTRLQVLLVDIPRSGTFNSWALLRLRGIIRPPADLELVVSLTLFLIVGIYTRRVPNRRLYIMAASTITPFIGLIALSMIPNSPANKWTKWGMYLITVPYVLALFLAWTLIPSNVAGRTKKTIISSATFLGYCVGNMAGSQIFKEADAPRYGKLSQSLSVKSDNQLTLSQSLVRSALASHWDWSSASSSAGKAITCCRIAVVIRKLWRVESARKSKSV